VEEYMPEERHVAAATGGSYHIDTNKYTDTGATDHIMGELEKLAICEEYHGGD
jgi:hypothetical protein